MARPPLLERHISYRMKYRKFRGRAHGIYLRGLTTEAVLGVDNLQDFSMNFEKGQPEIFLRDVSIPARKRSGERYLTALETVTP